MRRTIPIGPVAIPVVQAGPRRGSDAPTAIGAASPVAETIEACARIAESYADRKALSTRAMAKDIAAEIRALAIDMRRRRDDSIDFPPEAFV